MNAPDRQAWLQARRVCLCGCGAATSAGASFAHGHWAKTSAGRARLSAARFRGSVSSHGDGYLVVRQSIGITKLQHVAIAERLMGGPLPRGAEVHHVNGVRSDNRSENLVVCPDTAYHQLLHRRQRALDACGDPDKRQCSFCRKWDDKENLYIPKRSGRIEHRACGRVYRAELKKGKLK